MKIDILIKRPFQLSPTAVLLHNLPMIDISASKILQLTKASYISKIAVWLLKGENVIRIPFPKICFFRLVVFHIFSH